MLREKSSVGYEDADLGGATDLDRQVERGLGRAKQGGNVCIRIVIGHSTNKQEETKGLTW